MKLRACKAHIFVLWFLMQDYRYLSTSPSAMVGLILTSRLQNAGSLSHFIKAHPSKAGANLPSSFGCLYMSAGVPVDTLQLPWCETSFSTQTRRMLKRSSYWSVHVR